MMLAMADDVEYREGTKVRWLGGQGSNLDFWSQSPVRYRLHHPRSDFHTWGRELRLQA